MEKIRVNMTPCEEVKTIHASQNDNATRKWAFDLYDENGKIDSSSIKEQMIFDSRVGGTEQILPENTSDPTTSPIIADIQYPDSLRSEQTFLYRESPTTVNGQSKITHIKGNTLVWNQLARQISLDDWVVAQGASFTISNNIATIIAPNAWSGLQTNKGWNIVQGHKYLYISEIKKTVATDELSLFWGSAFNNVFDTTENTTNWQKVAKIQTATANATITPRPYIDNRTANISYQIKNIMFFDLTQMGLDTLTIGQFTSLYPLPYYDYTTGKLLPFVGTELKTVGFNQWDEEWELGALNGVGNNSTLRSKNFISVFPNTDYYFKGDPYGFAFEYDADMNYLSIRDDFNADRKIFTMSANTHYVKFVMAGAYGTTYNNDICISISSSENGKYEPYISSTINLPTLGYFPTGMKSAGNFYDEKTDSKAVTRVKTKDLSELPWSYDSNGFFYTSGLDWDLPKIANSLIHPISCAKYYVANFSTSFPDGQWGSVADKTIAYHCSSTVNPAYIYIKDTSFNGNVTNFTNALNGAVLYYATKSPTEESITTASLVTEKGEAPLYYDDELIADCNETISSESGIFDAKIKLMNDETIYSQKIQLHVERKP